MNCWGWATWEDRWVHFNKNPKEIANSFSKNDIYDFNLDGCHNFWLQIIENIKKKKHGLFFGMPPFLKIKGCV